MKILRIGKPCFVDDEFIHNLPERVTVVVELESGWREVFRMLPEKAEMLKEALS